MKGLNVIERMDRSEQRYAIAVLFLVKAEAYLKFLKLVHANAEASVLTEPDCIRFDVLTPFSPLVGHYVFLYEIYENRAAFKLHLESDHFKSFEAATRDIVLSKAVNEYAVTENVKD